MSNTLIGHIVKVDGKSFTIALLSVENGYTPIINIEDRPVLVGQIGSHVSIIQHGVHVLGSVTKNWQ